jgi:hypothetical protein
MDRDNENEIDIDALLKTTLDAYGANPERWPLARRAQLIALTQSDPAAASLLGEARAVDRLLEVTAVAQRPEVPLDLVARIMTTATNPTDGQGAQIPAVRSGHARGGEVVHLDRTRPLQTDAVRTVRPTLSAFKQAGCWPAAAMLAASLLVGVFIGGTGQLSSTVTQLNALLGDSSSVELAILLPLPVPDGIEQLGDDPL